jgi:hypothetical protein
MRKPKKTNDNNKIKTRVIVKQVMDEMHKTKRRVLNWNDALGCWKVLTDESQIFMKIEYLVREHRNTVAARANRQSNQSSTSMFCNSGSGSNKTTICCDSDSTSSRDVGDEKKIASGSNEGDNMSDCFGMKFFASN